MSAHRMPEDMIEYGRTAAERGLKVIIAGAGGAAHLPGMLASVTSLPVIGVPVPAAAARRDGLPAVDRADARRGAGGVRSASARRATPACWPCGSSGVGEARLWPDLDAYRAGLRASSHAKGERLREQELRQR